MSGHLDKLKREYLEAPLHQPLNPDVRVSEGGARVTLRVEPSHFYPRDSADAALIFKALHDAAFLAASSLTPGGALLTTCFSMDVSDQVWAEEITALGRVVSSGRRTLTAEVRLYNSADEEVATGEGTFSHSNAG